MTLLMTASVFADTSFSYTFSDGSSDEWAQSEVIAISENYGIAVLDFASAQEEKQFSYEVVDIDVFDISAEDLTSDVGDIIDTGTDPIYVIAFNEEQTDISTLVSADMASGDMMYTNDISLVVEEVKDDMLLFGLMPTDTEDEETQEEDLETAVSSGTPLLNEDGNVIAIALSSFSAVPVSSFYEDIEDYIEGTLDFSALESLISQAAQIDTDDYLDTTDLQIALVQAKNVYLTATSQEEIDEAYTVLKEAINGLEEDTGFDLNMTLIIAVIIIIAVIVLAVIFTSMIKKKAGKTKKTTKKVTDFDEIEYEDSLADQTPPAYDPGPRQNSYTEYQRPEDHYASAGDRYANAYKNMLSGNTYDSHGNERNMSSQEHQNDHYQKYESVDEPPTSMLATALLIRKKTGEKIPVSINGFTIGRGNASYRIADNLSVGRTHARILWNGSGYVLEDLNSMNGTFLNGQKIQHTMPLADRDRIRFADEEFEFRIGGIS